MTPSEVGLISGYHFATDGSARRIDNASLPRPDDSGWTWLHFGLADMRSQDWLTTKAPVSDHAREVLLGRDEMIQLDILGDEIVGVLPDLHQDFINEGDDVVRIRFVILPNLMITTRRKPLRSIELTRRALDLGRRFPTPISLLDGVVDQFAEIIGHHSTMLGDKLDAIEHAILNDEIEDKQIDLGRLRLDSMRTHRQLLQIRSLFHRLETRADVAARPIAAPIRILAQRFDAIDYELNSLYERARLLQDEVAGRMTAITNRRLFALSMLSALLLPSTLVTGFFGMNTKDMPLQATDGGTWYALIVVVLAGAFTYWLLKRLKAL